MLNCAQKLNWLLLLVLMVALSGTGTAKNTPPPLSGTKYIGTGTFTQNYATLTAAFADITTNTLGGNLVLVLQSGYSSAGETLPIVAPAVAATGSYSVTIYPDANGRVITGSNTTAIIDLNGSKNIIMDGRVNGTGSTKSLVIENTNTGGATIRFINDASNNTVKYCTVKGVATSTTSGVIFFSTTTATNGNNDNTIDNCDIRDGVTTPANGIYAAGTANKENSGNTISNCNVYNFFSASSSSGGIMVGSGNTQWTISGNSFYQTASRTSTAGSTHYGIQVNTSTTSGFTISNNYVGGGTVLCGGTAWTITGSFANRFIGINLTTLVSLTSSVQGNTIKNFNWSTTSGAISNPGIWCGIYLNTANANVGTVTGNTIGSATGTGSIQCTTSTGGGMVIGIALAGTTSIANIANNSIGAIITSGSSTSVSSGIVGIYSASAATLTINNNVIGSTTTANSLWANTASTGTVGQAIYGIIHSGNATLLSITNNTIANLRNAYAGTGTSGFIPVIRGISVANGTGSSVTTTSSISTITGNTIYKLVNEAPYTGVGNLSSVMGILSATSSNTAGSITLNRNTVHSLQSTAATAAVSICGINYFNNVSIAGYSNQLQRNTVHSLVSASSGASALRGILVSGGRDLTVGNNMVRLGLDTAGTALTGNYDIIGVSDGNTTANYYHNSVYIGGTGVTGTSSTYAFNSATITNTRSFRNNIFVNARSNGTGTGVHYAVAVGGTGLNPAGLTMSNNLYYTPGTGGKLGRYNSTDYTALSAWQAAAGVDYPSISANPNFITPAGTATTGNLHLTGTTPAEGVGVDVGVTDDFDGETRSGLTPVDLGADAGGFTANDLMAPAFSLTALLNSAILGNRTISATITDGGTGVPTTGSLVPRVWFRRVSPSTSAWGSTAGTLTSGNGNSGVWSFTIDYSQISITPAADDSIQYYFVAQDQAGTPNIGFNTFIGAAHTNVNTQTTAATSPLVYKILTAIATNVNVGTGQTYTSLTGAGGLFAAINTGALTGNTTVNITSDLSETGATDLTAVGLYGYTLTVQPSSTIVRVISNSTNLSQSMIRLYGVTGVTFDGRSGGSGQYLRIVNTHTIPSSGKSAVEFLGSTTNSTVRNCIVETNSTANVGTILLGTGTNTGITISNNDIRDAQGSPGTAGIPAFGVFSFSSTNVVSVQSNNVYNFTSAGVGLVLAGNQCDITGNSFYYNSATIPTTGQTGIYIYSGNNHTINNNYIGGSAPNCGGTAWINNGPSNSNVIGIETQVGTVTPTSIQGNTIQNFNIIATGTVHFYGILHSSGSVNIGTTSGNTIGHPTTANSILSTSGSVSGNSTMCGINNTSFAGIATISNNIIANIYNASTGSNVFIIGVFYSGSAQCTVTGNVIQSLTSGGNASLNVGTLNGIYSTNTNTAQVISGNTIYNLTNLNTIANSPIISGIRIEDSGSQGIISSNRIYGLTGKATAGPVIAGISFTLSGGWTASNNMISLSDSATTNSSVIIGIRELSAANNNIYYNSVYISGSTGSTGNSYGFLRSSSTSPTLANNIFYNARTAGTGRHYAIGNTNATPATGWTSLTSNYNLYVTVDSTKMGEWGSGVSKAPTQWKASSGGDANSYYAMTSVLSAANLFSTPGTADLHVNTANAEKSYVENKGTPIATVTADYDGTTRSLTTPELGADELNLSALLRLTALVEGLYNTGSNTMIADTMKVYLRRTTAPYTIVDSSRVLLSTAGQGIYSFTKTIRDSSFYLQLYNKRALETWSKTGVTFNADTVNYDFTTAANKAYGDNQVLRGTKYCLYSGDVNGDGVIDFSDLIQIDNDNANFVTGESSSDLNGDGVVDLTDLLLADNNNANFISRVTPLISKRVINPRPVKVLQY